jgi:hypothetical protein
MGGLSVFTQKELVETVSEAALARARAEIESREARGRMIRVRAIGGLAVLGVGLLLAYDTWKRPGPRELQIAGQTRASSNTKAALPPQTAPHEGNSAKRIESEEEDIRVEGKDPVDAAKLEAMTIISVDMHKLPNLKDMRFQAFGIRLLPSDPRKIPWLWEATATTALALNLREPDGVTERGSCAWRLLLQLTPELKGVSVGAR